LFRFHFSVLKPGDTISVTGQASSGLAIFHHLGIYLGNDEVIDYTNDSEIRRIHINTFTENRTRPLFRAVYVAPPAAYSPDVIVERAANVWRNPSEFGEYSVTSNNCEHFVTYCTFGEKFSLQVEEVQKAAAMATAAICQIS